MTETRKRLSKGVYVRRRIAVLIGLLALIAMIIALIVGPEKVAGWFGGSQTAGNAQTEDQGGSAESSSEPTPAPEPGPCEMSRIGVAAVSDQTSYAADELPKLSLRVTNHNEVECDADLGTETMAFVITSGAEVYWDSRHCQLDGEEFLVRMKPGQTLETAALEWKRERSSPETCGDETRPKVPAGGVSYHLAVEVAGVKSASTQQFLVY